MSDETVEIQVFGKEHDTSKAWLLKVEGGDKMWFPKSQCDYDEDDGIITIPEWLAIEKGLV